MRKTVPAYPVRKGHCPYCGSRPRRYWTPARIIGAIKKWAKAHDGEPPKAHEWAPAAPGHPDASSVVRIFGSWNNAIKAAGFTPRPHAGPTRWTRERVIEAIFNWRYAHGRLPTHADWNPSGGDKHPNATTVTRLFGGWNAALLAAGYVPNRPDKRGAWPVHDESQVFA